MSEWHEFVFHGLSLFFGVVTVVMLMIGFGVFNK